jgi:hypothetical protein
LVQHCEPSVHAEPTSPLVGGGGVLSVHRPFMQIWLTAHDMVAHGSVAPEPPSTTMIWAAARPEKARRRTAHAAAEGRREGKGRTG